jgi:hypothetical protein
LGNIGLKEQKFLGKLAENGFFSLKFGILGEIGLYLAFWGQPGFYADFGPICLFFKGLVVLKKRTWLFRLYLAFRGQPGFCPDLRPIYLSLRGWLC